MSNRKLIVLVLAVSASLPAVAPAGASSSDWYEAEGGRVRIVTRGTPDADGKLTGILDIDLKPGWKTYWRDPGDAGVPPSVDIAASPDIASAVLDFPPPQRHDEGDFKWAGYDHPVAFPITFTVKSPGAQPVIDADVFLGICETICVPLKTNLTLDPASDPDNPDDSEAISEALEALPDPETPDFGVTVVSQPGDATIVLEARFPGDPVSAQLFIAGEDGYTFTTPERSEKNGRTFFSTDVDVPARIGTGPGLHYTLVTDAGSVSGLLPYP